MGIVLKFINGYEPWLFQQTRFKHYECAEQDMISAGKLARESVEEYII